MEGIPHCVVPHNALTTIATDHAVVAQDITAQAWLWLVVNWEARPEFASNKLGAADCRGGDLGQEEESS